MSAVAERQVKLFKNGRNQPRIPREFETPCDEAVIPEEGDRLIIEPLKNHSLLNVLSTWQPSEEGLPDVDEGLLQLDDVEL